MIVINMYYSYFYTLLMKYMLLTLILLYLNYPGIIKSNIFHEFNLYYQWYNGIKFIQCIIKIKRLKIKSYV